VDEDRLSPEMGRLIDAAKAVAKQGLTAVPGWEGVALLGVGGAVGVGRGPINSVFRAQSAAATALADLRLKEKGEVIAAAVATDQQGEDTVWPSAGTLEVLRGIASDLPVAIKRCGRWVAVRVSDLVCDQTGRASRHLEGPISSELRVVRVTRPNPGVLELLAAYDREAFGSLGLRTCDLAVMAEAGAVFVAKLGDEVVGSCQMMRMLEEPGFVYLVGFYVRPQWQGQGLGRRFLELILVEAQARGAQGVCLTVSPSNLTALALYRGLGFKEEDVILGFYGPGEDRVILRLRFEENRLTGSV